jgi:hypothetical protein
MPYSLRSYGLRPTGSLRRETRTLSTHSALFAIIRTSIVQSIEGTIKKNILAVLASLAPPPIGNPSGTIKKKKLW